ncbi:MAG: hypothetical protein PHD97_07335 [Bacteroidales bacterium]|nr:hypothetical protein [Bacteroidales bacterium]
MRDRFKSIYRIESTRLPNWDYSRNGDYFVTICTGGRNYYFGDIENGKMKLSETGEIADRLWLEITKHFLFIELDEYVIMPNHVHGIIKINNKNDDFSVETGQCPVSTTDADEHSVLKFDLKNINNYNIPSKKRFRNQGKNTLSSIIGSYKSAVSKYARNIKPDFYWQSRFYDHIIRNNEALINIRKYIKENPEKWIEDRFNTVK